MLSVELIVRLKQPFNVGAAGIDLPLFRDTPEKAQRFYTLDPVLGFRPVLGTALFDEHGVRPNEYDFERPRPDADRVLFIGDSVTFRHRLVDAVRKVYGEESYEYWNGGVTAYNTAQEVEYFRRYTSSTRPRQVVLTFHLNDFMTTPISFRDSSGRLRVIAPAKSRSEVDAFLFRYSHLYRYYVGATRSRGDDEAIEEIRAQLAALQALCAENDATLAVILFPILEQPAKWPAISTRRHALMLATFQELGLRYCDLRPPLEEALARGIDVQEARGDRDHPSSAACEVFAAYLKEHGLLYPSRQAPLQQ